MATRLDYLKSEIDALSERYKSWEPKPGEKNPDAIAIATLNQEPIKQQIAALMPEYEWLQAIDRALKFRHTWGQYGQERHIIHTGIMFDPVHLMTPFNIQTFTAAVEPSPAMPDYDMVTLPAVRADFSYSLMGGLIPPRDMVGMIQNEYLKSQPLLKELVAGVYFANRALMFEQRYRQAFPNDRSWFNQQIDEVYERAGEAKSMTQRLVKYMMEHYQFRIDWSPF